MKCPIDNGSISKSAQKPIVILGGGFGGVYAALHLERLLAREPAVEICLTFVVAGGGFAGVETVAALNDFVREALPFYPNLRERMLRVVLVHPGAMILPELGERLG